MKHERIMQGEPDTTWIIAAHEAGRIEDDPFYAKGNDDE